MKTVLFFWSIILFFNAYPQQSNKTIDDYYNDGVAAYQNKNYQKFLENFKTLDSLRSNNAAIMYNLACAYSLTNRKDEALIYLMKYSKINSDTNISEEPDFNNIKSSTGFELILKKIKEQNKLVNNSDTAFVIEEKDLHPESIAYDDVTQLFYLGSIHKRKIISLNNNGNEKIFIPEKQDGIWAVTGIKINSKDRILWAASAAIPQMNDYEESLNGKTAIFKYDLDSKKLLKKYPAPNDSNKHFFGDLAINKNGDVYISDSKYPAIYLIKKKSNRLELFYENKNLISLQGLDFVEDNENLFFADYSNGLFKLNLKSKILIQIKEPDNFSLKGIDGLYFYNNSLIAIQNGVKPKRVTQYFLNANSDKIIKTKIIESANPNFNEPTLGVIVNDDFYFIANSQWGSYNKDGSIFPPEKLEKIIILKTTLAN